MMDEIFGLIGLVPFGSAAITAITILRTTAHCPAWYVPCPPRNIKRHRRMPSVVELGAPY